MGWAGNGRGGQLIFLRIDEKQTGGGLGMFFLFWLHWNSLSKVRQSVSIIYLYLYLLMPSSEIREVNDCQILKIFKGPVRYDMLGQSTEKMVPDE